MHDQLSEVVILSRMDLFVVSSMLLLPNALLIQANDLLEKNDRRLTDAQRGKVEFKS